MKNADIYHYSDFTFDNYRQMIRLAKQSYEFRSFTNFRREERFVIWRHDVDFCVESALRFAKIEAEEGVSAVYFLLLRGPFYNLLSQDSVAGVKEIIGLGHEIGLHFDATCYPINTLQLLEIHLNREKRILEEVFERKISVFSFHMPNDFTQTCRSWQYASMINTYAEYFQTQVDYCSDSNGYWRGRRLQDVLSEAAGERLQVLTHPEWWQETVMSQVERLEYCIQLQGDRKREWYQNVINRFGRAFTDWD